MKCRIAEGALLSILAITSPQLVSAETEWTGWLGPDRTGWVSGFQPPTIWPEQLQEIWRVKVGSGYGTALVSENRVYQHARIDNNEVLWCLSLKTGDVIWRQESPTPFKMGGGGEPHGKGPKSNPTLADGRLFTMSITGKLSAFDASTGTPLWQKDYGSRFEKPHPYWGATTSPLVDNDQVVIHFGGDDEGLLVALDVETGRERWSLGNDGAAYASPFTTELFGVRQIVEWNHNALIGVESASGRKLWEYALPHRGTNQNMPTPCIHEGCILVGGENRGIRSVQPILRDGVWSVVEKWHQKRLALDMSSAVVNGDFLYGFSHYRMGQLFCLNTNDGEIVWEGPGRAGDNATFLAIPNHVIALLDDGELHILATQSNQLRKIATYTVSDQPTWAAPVLLHNGFLIKDRETLTLWSMNRDINPLETPAR